MKKLLINGEEIGSLYKYCNWKKPYHRRILKEGKIYFASLGKLNDPYESHINPSYDNLSFQDLFESLKYYFKLGQFNTDDALVTNMATMYANEILRDKEHFVEMIEHYEEMKNDYYGVFSTSQDPSNLLMWSHYADAHQGLCIGFNAGLLYSYFDRMNEADAIPITVEKVRYLPNPPKIYPRNDSDVYEYVYPQITVKCDKWAYEKEIRFILHRGANIEFDIPKEAINQIIFGYKMDNKTRNKIENLIIRHDYHVQLFQATLAKNSYELQIEPSS
jgi:hypothetical protein